MGQSRSHGGNVLVFTKMKNPPVTHAENHDEGRGRLMPGNSVRTGQIIFSDYHFRIRSVMDYQLPELVEADRQRGTSGGESKKFDPVQTPSARTERELNDDIISKELIDRTISQHSPLPGSKDITWRHDGTSRHTIGLVTPLKKYGVATPFVNG